MSHPPKGIPRGSLGTCSWVLTSPWKRPSSSRTCLEAGRRPYIQWLDGLEWKIRLIMDDLNGFKWI
jgi:hypothetical protein